MSYGIGGQTRGSQALLGLDFSGWGSISAYKSERDASGSGHWNLEAEAQIYFSWRWGQLVLALVQTKLLPEMNAFFNFIHRNQN